MASLDRLDPGSGVWLLPRVPLRFELLLKSMEMDEDGLRFDPLIIYL